MSSFQRSLPWQHLVARCYIFISQPSHCLSSFTFSLLCSNETLLLFIILILWTSEIYKALLFAKFYNQQCCDFLHVDNGKIHFYIYAHQHYNLLWFCGFAFHWCFVGCVALTLCFSAMQIFIFLETMQGIISQFANTLYIAPYSSSFFSLFCFFFVHFVYITIF